MNKELLCEAFCQELEVSDVPVGLVVRTGFLSRDGDALGFYLTRHPTEPGQWRVEDSGLVVPMLEASGVNLDAGVRAKAFHRLLDEYQASFDEESLELHSEYFSEDVVPAEAMRFVALLLRIQDLELLNTETVANSFKDDVVGHLARFVGANQGVTIQYRVPPHKLLMDFETDALIQNGDETLALYIATADERVNEAVILWMENKVRQAGLKVALMLEREKPSQINNRSLRRAMNRLDATAVFRNDEWGSLEKVASLVSLDLRNVNPGVH